MDDEFARWKWNFKEDANETRRVSFKRSKVNTILHTLPARSLARVTRESERNKEKREKKRRRGRKKDHRRRGKDATKRITKITRVREGFFHSLEPRLGTCQFALTNCHLATSLYRPVLRWTCPAAVPLLSQLLSLSLFIRGRWFAQSGAERRACAWARELKRKTVYSIGWTLEHGNREGGCGEINASRTVYTVVKFTGHRWLGSRCAHLCDRVSNRVSRSPWEWGSGIDKGGRLRKAIACDKGARAPSIVPRWKLTLENKEANWVMRRDTEYLWISGVFLFLTLVPRRFNDFWTARAR